MQEITLVNSQLKALVSDHWFDYLIQFRWRIDQKGYARCGIRLGGRQGKYYTLRMHRIVLGLGYNDPRQGDHIDHNKLNNQVENLRIATRSQNQANTQVLARKRENSPSKYKGVTWNKQRHKWQAQIGYNNGLYNLGFFVSELDAAIAYNQKAIELFGEFARLNEL